MLLSMLIVFYQHTLSPDTGIFRGLYPAQGACRMYPSCSEYMKLAVKKYGLIKGFALGILRIGRCHPWQKKLIDAP